VDAATATQASVERAAAADRACPPGVMPRRVPDPDGRHFGLTARGRPQSSDNVAMAWPTCPKSPSN